jgi:carotenoid cleavage dioxygenase-like enzyme
MTHLQFGTRREFLRNGGTALAGSMWAFGPHGAVASGLQGHGPAISPWTSSNPALRGAFEPVFDERDDTDLKVEGEIPRGLWGVFMRNGPNPQYKPDDHYAYPFDGTGMVHAIYIENGRARYRNRWVMTKEVEQEKAAGQRLFNSSFSAPPHADLANTNIIHHAGRYLALYEAGVPYELDRDLNTKGLFNYEGKLPSVMSAHPKVDPFTGELLSVAYHAATGALAYICANKQGQLDTIVPFQGPWGTLVHDIAFTKNHVVAFLGPLVFDRSHPGPPATWQPDRGTMIAVIPRDAKSDKDVIWIQSPPFFQFHTMNAFAEGDQIEVTFPWYDSFSLTHSSSKLELHRLVIDLQKRSVVDQALDDQACEFSRVNDAYLSRKARYGYVGLRDPRPGETPQIGAFEAIARYDLLSGKKFVHQLPPGATVCEPVFVAEPHGKSEEDGFIFSFVHQQGEAGGSFVILDARHLSGKPLATVHLPRRVPAGLHGSWIPA